MAETCLNCGNPVMDNYCSNCGQKKFKRIDKKYIWNELQYTVFHTNKGFLYSIKRILKNPGKTAREFIDGSRVNHYKPILLVFVLSGVATFISYKILNVRKMMSDYFSQQQQMNSKFTGDLMSFLSSYTSILMLLSVPLFALTTKIAFRKWGHNYYEHIVMNAYILSFYTLVSIVFVYPIMFFFRNSPDTFYNITQVTILLVPIMLVWFFKEFYKDKPLKPILLKVLGVCGLTIAGYLLFIILGGLVVFATAVMKGPEAFEYMKPN